MDMREWKENEVVVGPLMMGGSYVLREVKGQEIVGCLKLSL